MIARGGAITAVTLAGALAALVLAHSFRPTDSVSERYPVRQRTISPLFDPTLAQALLNEPARDAWQKPDALVDALGIRPGDVVADIGAGSGYLMPRLSRAVGCDGMVYAEEIQDEFISQLRRKSKGLKNVQVVHGAAADPKLPSGRIDHFVMLTVYHEVQQPVEFLKSLKRFASPRARLAVIDFDAQRKGTPPAPAGHELPERDVIAEAQAAGWTLVQKHEFLSSQFFLVFSPARPGAGKQL